MLAGETLYSVPLPPHSPGAIIAGSFTVLINVLPGSHLGDTIVETFEPPNKILAGCGTVLIGG
jgi:uncharacterized Zn-binding protein involved in type VI secretion